MNSFSGEPSGNMQPTRITPDGDSYNAPRPVPPAFPNAQQGGSPPAGGSAGSAPALGTPITASVPPIVLGASAQQQPTSTLVRGQPRVEIFNEEVYSCRPGDTFENISQRCYYDRNYGRALLLYNRDHPQAGGRFAQDPSVLQPSQPVFIPEIRILEERYARAIPNLKPVSALANSSQPIAQPQSAAPLRYSPAAVAPTGNGVMPAGSQASVADWKMYRVRTGGETMRAIARSLLSNGDRWSEIYKLNPGWRPEYAIPEGTLLYLPGDARIP